MTYQYSAVARDNIILAQHANAAGNFDTIAQRLLSKITAGNPNITADEREFRFFIIHDDNGMNFLTCGPSTNQAGPAFELLNEIKKRFMLQYSRNWQKAPPFGMQQEFSSQLKSLMNVSSNEKIAKIKSNLQESQETMSSALEAAMLRNQNLNNMEISAERVAGSAKDFQRTAKQVRYKMCWEKYRMYVLAAIVAMVIIFVIVVISCGGFTFAKCKSTKST